MGMFDSAIVTCLVCDADTEVQTKAGECRLARWTDGDRVPDEAAARALDGIEVDCDGCGQVYRLTVTGGVLQIATV